LDIDAIEKLNDREKVSFEFFGVRHGVGPFHSDTLEEKNRAFARD
jgi:hypothetical protein